MNAIGRAVGGGLGVVEFVSLDNVGSSCEAYSGRWIEVGPKVLMPRNIEPGVSCSGLGI